MDALFHRHDSAHGRAICLKSHNAYTDTGVPGYRLRGGSLFHSVCLPDLLSYCSSQRYPALCPPRQVGCSFFAFSGRDSIVNRQSGREESGILVLFFLIVPLFFLFVSFFRDFRTEGIVDCWRFISPLDTGVKLLESSNGVGETILVGHSYLYDLRIIEFHLPEGKVYYLLGGISRSLDTE